MKYVRIAKCELRILRKKLNCQKLKWVIIIRVKGESGKWSLKAEVIFINVIHIIH